MLPPLIIVNYAAWFVFVYIAVVWLLVRIQHGSEIRNTPAPPGTLPSVTVLIPAFNEEQNLAAAVASVLGLDYPLDKLRAIVINDASTDRTGEIADRLARAGRVRALHNPRNLGKAASLNLGIAAARTPFIACIDADSTIHPQALRRMVGHFQDPAVAAVTPALHAVQPRTVVEKIQHAEYVLNAFMRKMLHFLDAIHVTPGVFSVYRADALRAAGGFAEGNLTEDMEIALRLHDRGYRITNEFSALSFTICPAGWRELFRQRIRWYRGAIRNSILYRRMFFNPRYGNLGMFMMPLNFLSILMIFGVLGSLLWNVATDAVRGFWQLSLVNWDLLALWGSFDPGFFLSTLYSTPLMLGVTGVALSGYLLLMSFRSTGEGRVTSRFSYLLYLLFFPIIMMAVWVIAFALEAARAPAKW